MIKVRYKVESMIHSVPVDQNKSNAIEWYHISEDVFLTRSISSTESNFSRGRPCMAPLRTSSLSIARNCCQLTVVGDERTDMLLCAKIGSTRVWSADSEADASDSKSSAIL